MKHGTTRRRLWPLLASCTALLCLLSTSTALAAEREWHALDNWRFLRSNAVHASLVEYDDSAWSMVRLPHTYNASDGDDGGSYYRGVAWYRHTLKMSASQLKRIHYLQFDGAALITDVWINGRHAGHHEGGYAAFRFNVSKLVHAGANVIAVRIDNSPSASVAPLGGDFTVFGGLYRSVRLLSVDALHIDPLDDAGPGVYATTVKIDHGAATIDIVTRLRNAAAQPLRAKLINTVRDARGRIVSRIQQLMQVEAGSVLPVTQTVTVPQAHLWNGRHDAYVYRLNTELVEITSGERISDRQSLPLGIRTIAIDPQRGLLLNDQAYAVHGVNLFHSGRPGKGLAVSDGEIDTDLRILEELGVTGLRLVHFQHPQHVYDAADRNGWLLWTEIPLNTTIDASPAFVVNISQQLRELIKQNYHHPSVVVWGLGNEVYRSDADSHRVLAELQRLAHALDSTRPTTYAHCCLADTDAQAMQTDVIAYNKYFGWYADEFKDFETWIDAAHASQPDRAMAISEYGAGASILHQQDPPSRPKPESHWHPEQYQALFHEAYWRTLRQRPYLWASFVWVGFDLASDGRDEGDRAGINDKGLVTYDRKVRKDAYYWYQANWSDRPMVHITSPRATPRNTDMVDIKVYSNAATVVLHVNGVALAAQTPIDRIAVWRHVPLRPGNNRIEASAGASHDLVEWRVDSSQRDSPTLTF